MLAQDFFFIIFAVTIIVTRAVLLPRRFHSPTILGLRLHHYMYGLGLVGLSFIFSNLTLYAIGLGIFADELPQIVTGTIGHDWKVYYSKMSYIGLALIIILAYVFRSFLTSVIM